MLLGHRVIQVACGSRDAQTLALTDEGKKCPPYCNVNMCILLQSVMHICFIRTSVFLGRWRLWKIGSRRK